MEDRIALLCLSGKKAMRENQKKRIAIPIILVLITALYGAWIFTGGDAGGERVIVTQVYDGDTIVVGRGWRRTTVRLIGVDTPETVHPEKPVQFYGPEASAFTRRSLHGSWVRLEFDDPGRPGGELDRYGRTLAYVFTLEGINFNLELVRRGYGRAYTRFPFRYMAAFKEAERAARTRGLGMWSRDRGSDPDDGATKGMIIGNRRSGIYHLPGQVGYRRVSKRNRVYFTTEQEAASAGYRKAKR